MKTLENIGGNERRIGQQYGTECGDRSEQDDAVASVGHEHEEEESGEDDEETHGKTPSLNAGIAQAVDVVITSRSRSSSPMTLV